MCKTEMEDEADHHIFFSRCINFDFITTIQTEYMGIFKYFCQKYKNIHNKQQSSSLITPKLNLLKRKMEYLRETYAMTSLAIFIFCS